MKADSPLKKHHFWILFAIVPLLTLIAVLVVSSNVGGQIAIREKAIEDAKSAIASKRDPKPNALIEKAGKVVEQVSGKQGDLHKINWDREKYLFTLPSGSKLFQEIDTGEARFASLTTRVLDRGKPDSKESEADKATTDKLIDQVADRVFSRLAAERVAYSERLPEIKKLRADYDKLKVEDRIALLRDALAKMPLPVRKAVLEPMWLKFGDTLPTDRGEFDEFRRPEVYLYEFSSVKKDGSGTPGTGMVDRVAPTQFRGGWQRVLRHVDNFGEVQLTKDQVWLLMEDIWIQRSLLDGVRSINTDLATFRRAREVKGEIVIDDTFDDQGNKWEGGKKVETPEAEKRKALFRSRTWAVELELVKDGGSQRLTGALMNLTDRLQLMGVGNEMVLHVWFSKAPSAQPMVFKIGGEFLPGKGAMKRDAMGRDVPANVQAILPKDDHLLPPGMTADEIVRVEQVFDIRTVPVKRIDALALGFLDARNAGKPLLPPNPPFAQEAAAPAPGGPGGPTGVPPGGSGSSASGPPGGMGDFPGGPGPMGLPGGGNTGSRLMGGGPLAAITNGNKKRYLEITSQVRRMPVGIVIVLDQAYMQDMLLAFANSPLRFQITQVAWTRFRGTLAGIGPGGGSGPGGDIDYGSYGQGQINFGGSGDPDSGRPTGPPGRPRPPVVGPGGIPMPVGPPMGPVGPVPVGPGGMGPNYPGSSPTASTVSESQITSSLVELSVYGIVSLYEKFEKYDPTDYIVVSTAPVVAAPPAPAAPAVPPTAPMTPMTPMTPMGTAPPKKRRRVRR
jgi:hypothetical protein